jgi:hypothetical protein
VSHLQGRTEIKIVKIFEALRTHGSLHIRGLARVTELHPATVWGIVSRFDYFFEIESVEVVPGFNAKIVRLKNPNVTIEDVKRYLEVKKQIKGV